MRPLKMPVADPVLVFKLCVSGLKQDTEKVTFMTVEPLIGQAGARYSAFALQKELHLLQRQTTIGGTVTIEEIKNLYSSAFSSRSGVARRVYDDIVNTAPNRICPLCGIGTVSSLDHHLPQSKYPEYVLIPANLVPSCFDCNKAKFTKFPKTAEQQTIHPYFDDYTQETWLYAQVVEVSPPALMFYVRAPNHWAMVDQERVKWHFDVFKLGRLFTSNAGNELGEMRSHLVKGLAGNEAAIKLHLKEQAETCRDAHVNSWRTAMYEALSNNEWFLGDGFREIPSPQ